MQCFKILLSKTPRHIALIFYVQHHLGILYVQSMRLVSKWPCPKGYKFTLNYI